MKIIQAFQEADNKLDTFEQSLSNVEERVNKVSVKALSEFQAEDITEINEIVTDLKGSLSKLRSELRVLRRPFFQDMQSLQDMLIGRLSRIKSPYYWAVETYSANNLAEFDEPTREIIKQTLREYFAPMNLTYEGWQ